MIKVWQNFIVRQSSVTQYFLLLIFCCVIVASGYAINLRKLEHRYWQLEHKKEVVVQDIKAKNRELQRLPRVAPVKENQNITQRDSTLWLEIMAAAIAKSQVEFKTLKPDIKADKVSVQIEVAGKYQNIISFYRALTEAPALVGVDNLVINSLGPSGNQVQLSGMVTIYFGSEMAKIKEQSVFPQGKERLRDLFSVIAAQKNTQLPLTLWAFSELRFVGTIKENDKIIGLLVDPFGVVHHVIVGDAIGLKQGVVARITEEEVVVREGKDAERKSVLEE